CACVSDLSDIALIKFGTDEFAVRIQQRDAENLLLYFLGCGAEMEALRLLQHQALIDERVEDLSRKSDLLFELRRELFAIHPPCVLLGEIERPVVLGEADGVAVHARGVRPVLHATLIGAAETHVDVDETDDECS